MGAEAGLVLDVEAEAAIQGLGAKEERQSKDILNTTQLQRETRSPRSLRSEAWRNFTTSETEAGPLSMAEVRKDTEAVHQKSQVSSRRLVLFQDSKGSER